MCLYNGFTKLCGVHGPSHGDERRLPSCLLLVTQNGTAAELSKGRPVGYRISCSRTYFSQNYFKLPPTLRDFRPILTAFYHTSFLRSNRKACAPTYSVLRCYVTKIVHKSTGRFLTICSLRLVVEQTGRDFVRPLTDAL